MKLNLRVDVSAGVTFFLLELNLNFDFSLQILFTMRLREDFLSFLDSLTMSQLQY